MEGRMDPRVMSAILGGFILLAAGPRAEGSDKTMTVLVTAAEVQDVVKIDKATEKRLQAAMKAARDKRKDLEKALQAKHGKKREAWPPEAQDACDEAEEAEALANADYA